MPRTTPEIEDETPKHHVIRVGIDEPFKGELKEGESIIVIGPVGGGGIKQESSSEKPNKWGPKGTFMTDEHGSAGGTVEPSLTRAIEEIKKEAREVMNDPYKGLRQTSNTNKSRMEILALIEEAYTFGIQEGMDRAIEITEKLHMEIKASEYEEKGTSFFQKTSNNLALENVRNVLKARTTHKEKEEV